LHFVGVDKPWLVADPMRYWTNRIWWSKLNEIEKNDSLGIEVNPFHGVYKRLS